MMILFSGLLLLFAPLLLGTAIAKIIGEKETTVVYSYMLGFFTLFILFGGMTGVIAKNGLPFTTLCMLFSCMLLLLCGASLAFACKDLQKLLRMRGWKLGENISVYSLCVGILIFYQVVRILKNMPAIKEEATIDILQMIQGGNLIGEGTQAITVFYAYLSEIFALPQEAVLYGLIPVWLLLVSYFVYDLWADCLVENKKKSFFLFLYSLLLLFGDTIFTTVSNHFYQQGWKGETIVIGIAIPFAIYLFLQKKHKKIVPAGLLFLAIFCLITIQFGNPTEPPLSEVAKLILHVNQTTNTYGKYQAFYYAALLFLFVRNRPEEKKLLFYNIVVLLLLWNPLVVKGCMWIFPQLTTYWQFLWLLPTYGVIAYAGTLAVTNIEEKVRKNEQNKKR